MTLEQPVSEFFTAGGTLPPDAPSYVKRSTDDELFRHIRAGDFCYVLTPRQLGKSSLMIRTSQRLQMEGIKSAIVDLTQIGTVESEEWYKGILARIGSRLRLSIDPVGWWEKKKGIPNIQKFIEFFEEMLVEVKEYVVIFLDEIDTTLELDFRDDFFAGIRAIFNARAENADFKRITFVLLGVASPSDLIKDRNRTPFNIGQEILLRPFSRESARMLEKGLEDVYPKSGRKILDRVFYWTNGHPYLTQKLCQSVVENQFDECNDSKIDLLVKNLFTSAEASRETNLQFVQDNLLSYPERRTVISLYGKLLRGNEVRDNKNSLPQSHLKLSGLARIEDGKLVVSNRIYSEVFNQKWVNKYTEFDWRYLIISVLVLVILGFSFVFFNDGVRLPNQAATRVNGIPIYKDDRGIQYLADLFRMKPYVFPNEYEYKAKDTFFNALSTWEEQKALIEVSYGEPQPPELHENYKTVVVGLYTSLADVDNSGQTTKLLDVMHKSLKELEMQDDPIYQEIGYWLEARKNISENNLNEALANYNSAINLNLENPNPAILFERARINVQLERFDDALNDYERVVAIVPESNIEPTEIVVLTSPSPNTTATITSTEISTPTQTFPSIAPIPIFTATLGALTPTVVMSPSVTTTSTPDPSPIQPRFLTRGQRIAAVKNDINRNKALLSFIASASLTNYPNLTELEILPLTPTAIVLSAGTLSPLGTTTSTLSIPFIQSVTKEDTTCYFGTNDGYDAFVTIPQYSIVSVLGKDSSGLWMLARLEGFVDCWIQSSSLQFQGGDGNLPVISVIFPPAKTPVPSTKIITTELVNQTPYSPIELTWKILGFDCNSNNSATRTLVDLNVSGGIPPYKYSQQLPLYAKPEEVVSIRVSSSTLDSEPSEIISFTIPRASDFKCGKQGFNTSPLPTVQPPIIQSPSPVPLPACSDGRDNDSDGFTDYPIDPQCDSPADTHENF